MQMSDELLPGERYNAQRRPTPPRRITRGDQGGRVSRPMGGGLEQWVGGKPRNA